LTIPQGQITQRCGKDRRLRATLQAILITFKNYFDVMRTNGGAITFEIGKGM